MNKASLEKIKSKAVRVLIANDMGRFTRPAPRLYPHQWNWDSALIAIGWSHINERRAQEEILSLFRGQWKNGMIPHILFDPEAKGYFPNPDYWKVASSPMSTEEVQTSGITQPPILAVAIHEVYVNSKNKEKATDFLREVYPMLKAYHAFLHRWRDSEGQGLVAIIHPWESGLDNSPCWDRTLERIDMKWKPKYSRVDRTIVKAEQRPSDEVYDRYAYLVEVLRDIEYDDKRVWDMCPFLVQPVLFNTMLYASQRCLKKIGDELGEDTSEIDKWMTALGNGIRLRLWDENRLMYAWAG